MQVLKKIAGRVLQFRNTFGIATYILISAWTFTGKATNNQQAPSIKEYEVKAAFLYNFTHFIEWPEQAFTIAKAPFVIGILGEDPFGNVLNEIIAGESVGGHPLVVQRYNSLNDITNCHILFISAKDNEILSSVLSTLKDKSTLTVSDIPDFALKGGMINFFIENNKVRLRINLDRTRASGLTIDSKLLRLAQIVSSKKD
jgi:hypothetical protein